MSTRLRILDILPTLDPASGGPAELVRRFAVARADLEVATTVAVLDRPGESWLDLPGAATVALGRGLGGHRWHPGCAAPLRALAAAHDLVVVHGLWQYHAWAGRCAARAAGKPWVVYLHGMLDPWFRRRYPLKHLKKQLYWLLRERLVVGDAAAVCATADSERDLARGSFRPWRARELVLPLGTAVPPAEDPGQAADFRSLAPRAGRRFILFLGRLHEKKGPELLLEGFARVAREVPELNLVLAGPDHQGMAARLTQRAAALGLADRICLPGLLQGPAKWGALRSAEAFCLPSHQENFAIAVTEALACGTPVLLSSQVAIWREILADGAGILAEDRLEGVEAGLRGWLALGLAGQQVMRGAAAACFRNRFEISAAARRQVEAFSAIVAGKPV